jgi:hypothetical protein
MKRTELLKYNGGIAASLDYAKSKYQESLENLGNQYYRDVIVPLETKYNLKFFCGNGDWFFVHVPTEILIHPTDIELYGVVNLACDEILSTEMCDDLTVVFEACSIELEYNNFFGYCIG